MKKIVKVLLPIILSIVILVCLVWYLFVYDRAFTRDILLSAARFSESNGYHSMSTWFYNRAYDHAEDSDSVAIELAEQYKRTGNYTKAEFTLTNAIAGGGGVDVYVALCKTYVEQDKILDALNMLNNITNEDIKQELESMRPAAPTCKPAPGLYSQYISVTVETTEGTLYVNANGEYPSTEKDSYKGPVTLQDGENNIYAVSVGMNGLVSPLAPFGFTVGGVIEKVTFSDGAMEHAIREILGFEAEKEIYTNDLWTIKAFTVPEGATNYAELKHMSFLTTLTIENGVGSELEYIKFLSNLEELMIVDTAVSQDNLADIAKINGLKRLTLRNCDLSGVSALADSTALTYLDLSENAIGDITVLGKMAALQEAYLQSNAIDSVAPLSTLSSLTTLDISHNVVTTIAPLSDVTTLTWLNASNNRIAKLGDIGKLKSLTTLTLEENELTGIGSVGNCVALTELNISGNSITDIANIAKLKELMYFYFSDNKVTELPKFSKDCALVTITGNNNDIKSLENLSGLKNLNTVNMEYNKNLSSLKPLASCHKLIEVNVFGTKVKSAGVLAEMSVIVNLSPID